MKNRARNTIAGVGLAGGLLLGSAVPAHASTSSVQCAYPQTTKEIIDCACLVAAGWAEAVLPGWTQWDCDSDPPG